MSILVKRRIGVITLSALCSALLLAGCGGGGGSDEQSTSARAATGPSEEAPGSGQPGPGTGTGPAPSPAPAPAPTPTPDPSPVPAPAPASAALPAETICSLPEFRDELMQRINQARASGRYCGSTYYDAAAPVRWNDKLFNAAAAHSTDMASGNYFSHIGRDGSSFSQRISSAGYAWKAAGENIAAGQSGVAQVMDGWLESPGHCANIMNAAYTEVGVSCAYQGASTYKRYWTMDLAAPR